MKNFLIAIFLISFSFGFSQKVKLKKDKVIIDDVEIYNYTSEGTITSFSTLSDSKEFISVISTFYEAPNPARSQPNGHNFPATIRKAIFTVKFLESGKELTTDLGHKGIIKAVFTSKLVDDNGKIDDEKLNIFINKYNNENLKYKIN